jgi:CO/xanthine dehydrogenase Mo-binding subunit
MADGPAEVHRYVSRPAPVREDRRFVTGGGRYVADIAPPGVLHVGLVPSPHAHARIESVDVAGALALDGVVDVLAGTELARDTEPLRQYLDLPEVLWRPLADGDTRYAGEWVAAVVAESRALAEDAAELVEVEYEPLEVVLDPEAAMRAGATLVHPRLGTNVFIDRTFNWGDVQGDFARAERSTRLRVRWNRNSTVPLETFGVVASWDAGSGLLDVWASIQMPQFPEQVAAALRLPLNRVRVHFDVDVGGSYGVKRGIKHAVLAGYLSKRLGRPVKLIEDRRENMHGGDFHGPDRIFDIELAYTSEGRLLSMRLHTIDDEGAYPGRSPLQLAKPIGSIVGPYTIGSVEYRVTGVATNKTGQVAVRGFGQSPTNYAIESAVDAVARELGIDRAELRRRNFPRADQFPYRIPSGTSYDSGDYHAVLDKALDAADIPALERRRDELRAEGRLAGIGIATCLEPGGGNAIFENVMNPKNDKTTFPEGCRLRIDGTGAITAVIAIASAGQGHETLVATLAGEELGRDPSAVTVLRTDSAAGLPSQSPVGSRMAIMLGAAVRGAATVIREKLVAIAAHALEANPADLVYDAGDVAVRGDPARRVGWDELVDIAHRRSHRMPAALEPGLEAVYVAQVPGGGQVAASDGSVQMYPTFSFEAHVILASVDAGTGMVVLERYGLAHDCGTVINPHIVHGMVLGGVAHGIGVALHERFAFDEYGQALTTSFMDYLLPSAHEIPHIEIEDHCTPSPRTSLGQKGAGEGGYMGAPAAVASAVNDALAPLGASIHSLPMGPSDIWVALRGARHEGGAG